MSSEDYFKRALYLATCAADARAIGHRVEAAALQVRADVEWQTAVQLAAAESERREG